MRIVDRALPETPSMGRWRRVCADRVPAAICTVCVLLSLVGRLPNAVACTTEDTAAIEFFETNIRPLFAEKCQSCHGDKKQEGGLRLTNRSEAIKGGDSGPAVVPGNEEESLLLRAVGDEADRKMPPTGKLTDSEIENLIRWIKSGAVWPSNEHGASPALTGIDNTAKVHLWSLQPVREFSPPEVHAHAWSISPVDHFILAALEQRGLNPSPPAVKRTLLRRITFDLTGLPPSPDQIREFLNDRSPTAFEAVVDRLLASPRYGERWGRHWLDVVRYADARDLIQLPPDSDFREAWRYRDWVVNAFNQDIPYDKFIELQIAGDLMQPADPEEIDADALVATGMLAIADFVPGDVDKDQMIADYVNDQVDVVGRAFLGMTIACARCHDHKFDPVSTEDYYSLAGIFFSTRLIPGPVPGNTPLVRVPLLSATGIRRLEAQTVRDRQRLVELSHRVQKAEDREYFEYIERQVNSAVPRDLPVVVEYFLSSRDPQPPTLAAFAAAHAIDAETVDRWMGLLNRQPALTALLGKDAFGDARTHTITRVAGDLANQLSAVAAVRREQLASDPIAQTVANAQMLQFRADDGCIATDAAGHITLWPDRAATAEDAVQIKDRLGPRMATVLVHGTVRPVLRFDGDAMLQVARRVPETGALFAVFRPDPGAAGTRLIGWEDSAVGQHGIGLMPTADGGLHAVLRREGANGDLVAPASGTPEFHLISLTWGPGGVALFRNGEAIGTNATIDSVSADPAITSLHLGGPGSGAGQRFRGDLCELRVFAVPLDEAARIQVETELRDRWLAPPVELTHVAMNDHVSELYDELLSPRSPYWIDPEHRGQAFPEEVRQRLAVERDELESLKKKTGPRDSPGRCGSGRWSARNKA